MSLETVSEEPVVVAAAADAVDDAPSTAVDEHSENVSTDTSAGDSSTAKEDSPSTDAAIEEEKKNENVEEEKEKESQVEENRCSPNSSSPVPEHDEEENSAVVSVKDNVEEDVKDVKDQLDNEEEQADEQDEEHVEEHDDGDDVVIEDVLDDESEIDSRSDIQSVSSIINAQHSDLDESFDEHDHEDRIAVYDSESDSHSHAPYDEDEELLEGEEKDGEEEEQKQSDAEDEDSEKNAIDDGGDTQQTNSEEHSDLSDSPSSSASDSSKDAKKAAAFSRPNNKFSGARGGRRGGGFQANRGDRYPDRRSFGPGPNTARPSNPVPPRRGGMQTPPLQRGGPRGEAEDGSTLFITNWGFRSNLIDQNGNFQRATTDLKNYIAAYKAKYFYFFDLVNGRYPQYVRTLFDKMEIWRMSFNVYASGFSDYIAHLGEIHAFYQMEYVDNELRWVYKDFNFYPNRMRYGFKVNTYDIADVHSRFVKFLCIRDNIIKQFPYVNIHHKDFIGKKFGDNLCNMMSRLEALKRQSPSISIASNHSLEREDEHVTTAAVSPPRDEQVAQPSAHRVSPPNDGGDGGGRFLAQTFERPRFKTTYHRSSGQGTPMPRRGLMSGRPVRRGNYRG